MPRADAQLSRSRSMKRNRRSFISCCLGLVGGALAGFVLKRHEIKAQYIRPPGALKEKDFLAACIRCGQCVKACPNHTLLFSGSPAGWGLGTPYVIPERTPCNLCRGLDTLKCIEACPSRALLPVNDHRKIRMGIAKIDQELCLAYNRVVCRSCQHACPFPDEAITFDNMLRPVIIDESCIGCGLCTYACPTDPRAVLVFPRRS